MQSPVQALRSVARPPRDVARRLRHASNARFDSRVVWIFGSPRSGSTWLLQLLRANDHVVGINEPLIGQLLSPFMADQPGIDSSKLDVSNFTVRRVQKNKPMQFFADEFRDVWSDGLGNLMRARFAAHVERYPSPGGDRRPVIAVKEPNGSQSADLLSAAMPDSRYLFLLRDPRDVLDSHLAAASEGSWASKNHSFVGGVTEAQRLDYLVLDARKWLWRTSVVQEAYESHRGPKLLVRYEDLRADTKRHLTDIVQWMGLPLDEAWISEVVDRHAFENIPQEQRGEKSFFRAATPGLWRERLTAEEQAAINEIVGEKVVELGYEL